MGWLLFKKEETSKKSALITEALGKMLVRFVDFTDERADLNELKFWTTTSHISRECVRIEFSLSYIG